MKKIYKNRLPKDKEVKSTNVRVENGEVVVEVELKDKFEPKDGDFCVDYYGNTFILCEEGNVGINHGSYAFLCRDDGDWYFQMINMTRAVRFATPKEKDAFLKRLENDKNLHWNAEKKCLEDIRWKPKMGEIFYYINTGCNVVRSQFNLSTVHVVENNNCFRNEEAAQKVADQIKEIFKNTKAE